MTTEFGWLILSEYDKDNGRFGKVLMKEAKIPQGVHVWGEFELYTDGGYTFSALNPSYPLLLGSCPPPPENAQRVYIDDGIWTIVGQQDAVAPIGKFLEAYMDDNGGVYPAQSICSQTTNTVAITASPIQRSNEETEDILDSYEKKFQKYLSDLSLYKGSIDGIIGPKTLKAVKKLVSSDKNTDLLPVFTDILGVVFPQAVPAINSLSKIFSFISKVS